MIHVWAQILAGLGLFFVGMDLLSSNLRSLTSRRFQRAVAAWTATPWQSFLWGMVAGALTQSMSVVTFIIVGLLVARAIDVKRGLPIILGCNVGACALLFLVSLDIGPAILLLVGMVGIAVTVDRLRSWRTVLWALFGIALLFVGLDFIKAGTTPLADSDLVREALVSTGGSYVLAFVIGVVLTVAVHSSLAIAVLALSLMTSGLFSFETAVVVIYATNFGSSMTTLILSSKLSGEARQLAMFQVCFNIVGCLIFLPLFALETVTGWPLVLALLEGISSAPGQRVAWTYLIFNSGAVLLLLPLLGPVSALLARLWPRTAAEDAARPAYIGDFALGDPDLAMDLAAQEHHRIYVSTAALLDPFVEDGTDGTGTTKPLERTAALRELLRATDGFLEDLGRQTLTGRQYDRFYGQLDDQAQLTGLLADVGRFADALRDLQSKDHGRRLGSLLGHSLHAVMHSCADALSPAPQAEDLETAATLTGDRGPALRNVREAYVGERSDMEDPALATSMLNAISLFERILWQVNAMVTQRMRDAADANDTRAHPALAEAAE